MEQNVIKARQKILYSIAVAFLIYTFVPYRDGFLIPFLQSFVLVQLINFAFVPRRLKK